MFSKTMKKSTLTIAAMMALVVVTGSQSLAVAQRWDDWRRDDRRDERFRRFSKNEVKEIARRNGFQFGMREGRFDSQRNGRFDLKGSRAYRDGMLGYRYEFNYERDYRNAFRDGFENGYRQGFASFGRRGNGNGNGNGPWWNGRGNTSWFRRQ